jgi:hypothetical protein
MADRPNALSTQKRSGDAISFNEFRSMINLAHAARRTARLEKHLVDPEYPAESHCLSGPPQKCLGHIATTLIDHPRAPFQNVIPVSPNDLRGSAGSG